MAQSRPQAAAPARQIGADVIVAIATPPGEGAIGVVRLSGPGCLRTAGSFLKWPRHELTPRTATLTKAFFQGRLLDEVVVTYFPGPTSYTGEDALEISAHGSPFVLARLVEQALASGARAAAPGEFTQRAYLHGRMDLAQAEAVGGLIRARTRLAHRAALGQLEGGLSSKVSTLKAELLDILAHLEAGLDHPDDDLPAAGAEELSARIEGARGGLRALSDTYRVGRLVQDGARIAIVGRPNAGKSSLLNALLGRERAIVSEIPGTTRDTLEEWADLDGLRALFIDTAGLRAETSDSIEKAGMERTRKAMANCDLVLAVIDRSRPLGEEDRAILQEIPADRPAIIALNKKDQPDRLGGGEWGKLWDRVSVCALTGEGVPELARAVLAKLSGAAATEENGVVVTSLRHRLALEQAELALGSAREKLAQGELSALHLRESLTALGAIVGETTSDDVLKTVFSKFCVGK